MATGRRAFAKSPVPELHAQKLGALSPQERPGTRTPRLQVPRAWAAVRAPVPLRGGSPGTAGPDAGTCRGPLRPEASRFLRGGATAPEQRRWRRRRRRRFGAGDRGCGAGAAASSRCPSRPRRVRASRLR
jgi:hypothetical protein